MANTLNGRLAPTNNMEGSLTNEGRLTGQLGGVGAVVTYASLPDKPSINNVELVGNKTTSDLNISYNDLRDQPVIPDVGEIDERLDDLESNTSALDGRLTTAEGNITSLGGRLTTAEGNITSLDGRVTTNEGDITDLQGDTSALDTRLTTAEGDITSLGGRVTTAEGNITSLSGRVATAEGNITTLQGDTGALGTRLTTAEGNITSLDGRVTTNEGDISDLQGDMSQAQSDISQLNSSIGDWKNITFSGTYSGELDGVYNNKLKLAIVSYNSKTANADYTATMNVTAKKEQFGAIRGGGYLQVKGTSSTISINNSAQWSVGQIIFTIL